MSLPFYNCENNLTSHSPAALPNYFSPYEHPCAYPTSPNNFYSNYEKPYQDEDHFTTCTEFLQQAPSALNQGYFHESQHQTVTDGVFGNPLQPSFSGSNYQENWGIAPIPQTFQIPYTTDNPTPPKPCDNTHGRRNLKKLLHKGYTFDRTQYLMLYTFKQLMDSSCEDIIWVDKGKGIFYIQKPEEFAKKWGAYKKKPEMSYQKVSRSFRYYYSSKLLRKSDGLRQYKWDKKALESMEEIFKNGTPLLVKTIQKK